MLKDGEPRVFTQLLNQVGLSHNALRQHLGRLEARGFVVEDKTISNGLEGPKLAYHVPPRVRQQVSVALSDPSMEIVSPPFRRLRHPCRFEKGGYCKEAKKDCNSENCPQTPKNKE